MHEQKMVIKNETLNELQKEKQELIRKLDKEQNKTERIKTYKRIQGTQEEIEKLIRKILIKKDIPIENKEEIKEIDTKKYYKFLIQQYRFHKEQMFLISKEKKLIRESGAL